MRPTDWMTNRMMDRSGSCYVPQMVDNTEEEESEGESDEHKFVGDELRNGMGKIVRVYFNNCNGLEINRLINEQIKQNFEKKEKEYLGEVSLHTKVEALLSTMKDWEVDICCLAGTDIAWEHKAAKKAVQMVSRRIFDRCGSITTSTSTVKSASNVKPGGTGIFTNGSWASRLKAKGEDPHGLGRWSFIEIEGRDKKSLTLVTGYRVGKQKIEDAGVKTTMAQQYGLLSEKGVEKPNPRQQFITDLKKWMKGRMKDTEFLLMVDANEGWEEGTNTNPAQIQQMSRQLGLINLEKEIHGRLPPSFPQSGRTIDFLLASEGVRDSVEALGRTPHIKGTLGDHRGTFVDINISTLLGIGEVDMEASISRKLQSIDVKASEKYIKKVEEHFVDHNVYNRMETLVEKVTVQNKMDKEDQAEYEKIDKDVFRLCRSAEKKCIHLRQHRFAWSPSLDVAMKQERLWRKVVKLGWGSGKKIIEELRIELGVERDGDTNEEHKIKWEEAKKNLKDTRDNAKDKRVDFLKKLAAQYAAANNLTQEKAVKELLAHEQIRDIFREIKFGMNQLRKKQMYRLWLPEDGKVTSKPPKDWKKVVRGQREVTDSEIIHTKLLERNRLHLEQAKVTPFAMSGIGRLLKWDGKGEVSDKILMGEDFDNDLSEVSKKYIEGLRVKKMCDLESVEKDISLEDYKRFWLKKKGEYCNVTFWATYRPL